MLSTCPPHVIHMSPTCYPHVPPHVICMSPHVIPCPPHVIHVSPTCSRTHSSASSSGEGLRRLQEDWWWRMWTGPRQISHCSSLMMEWYVFMTSAYSSVSQTSPWQTSNVSSYDRTADNIDNSVSTFQVPCSVPILFHLWLACV